MSDTGPIRNTANLVGDALTQVSTLVRKEVDLARTEMSENISRASTAVGLIAGAAIVALVALHVLAAALVVGLAELMGTYGEWAPLIVGLILAAVAYGMVQKGINDLKLNSLAPTRTAKNVQRDAQAVKDSVND